MQLYYFIQFLYLQLSYTWLTMSTESCMLMDLHGSLGGYALWLLWSASAWHAECFMAQMQLKACLVECLCCLVRFFNAWCIVLWSGMVRGASSIRRTRDRSVLTWRHQTCPGYDDQMAWVHSGAPIASVYNFFDEEESAASSLSECSDPCYRQEVHHHLDDLPDEDFVAGYITNRESLLRRARDSWETLCQ